jgi:hypothetical protein
MRVVNFATVSVDTTAGGTELFSSAQARIATTEGLEAIVVYPSVEIELVDADGLNVSSSIPGAVVGTATNSPFVCPANVPTVILHRSGPVRAISSVGTATVRVGAAEAP